VQLVAWRGSLAQEAEGRVRDGVVPWRSREGRLVTAECVPSCPCGDCGLETYPFELYMVTDDVWRAAGAPDGDLCVGCLEDRLDRCLERDDFQPLPLNDDREVDSVRLRVRKGSGRQTLELYGFGRHAVELGADIDEVADRLGLDRGLLNTWVENARFAREVVEG
jgi:hypothetical protein